MKRILLFGAQGQVGHRFAAQCKDANIPCIALKRSDSDFTAITETAAHRLVESYQPTHIINCAGFTAVDAAETQQELAYAINAHAPKILATVARERHLPFYHCSTDYVFDGVQGAPYSESAKTNPLNHYGKSKLYGEQAVLDNGGTAFRLQWVFDNRGSNFMLSMKKLLSERESIKVVADQLGAPSYAAHIAAAMRKALDIEPGLYHLAAAGHTSWHGFATAIGRAMHSKCRIAPIVTDEYPTPASRPKDTRLNTAKLAAKGIALPHWSVGLKEAIGAHA